MAYFPNGSAASDYHERYCYKCVNWRKDASEQEGCPIQDLHCLWNYDACNGENAKEDTPQRIKWEALEHFIPDSEVGYPQCKMFVPVNPAEVPVDKTKALQEWEAIYGKRA